MSTRFCGTLGSDLWDPPRTLEPPKKQKKSPSARGSWELDVNCSCQLKFARCQLKFARCQLNFARCQLGFVGLWGLICGTPQELWSPQQIKKKSPPARGSWELDVNCSCQLKFARCHSKFARCQLKFARCHPPKQLTSKAPQLTSKAPQLTSRPPAVDNCS